MRVPSGGHCYVFDRRGRVVLVVGSVVAAVLIFLIGLMVGREMGAQPPPTPEVGGLSEPSPELVAGSAVEGGPERFERDPVDRVPVGRSPVGLAATDPAPVGGPAGAEAGRPARDATSPRQGPMRASLPAVRIAPDASRDVVGDFELAFRETDAPPRTPYGLQIYNAARRHSLNPELLAAVIRVESAFDRWAVSPKGARGLMQVMPDTATRFGVDADRLFEPTYNLTAGAAYLRWLTRRYGGDLELVLAAYNSGEGAVERYGGVPPYRETRRYVVLVAESLRLTPSGGGDGS